MIKFFRDESIAEKIKDIVQTLEMSHVDLNRLVCVRSRGSGARATIARCYALSKIWQVSLDMQAHYVIEVISERYDKMNDEDKEKVLIHELMHVPFSFGGGFKHHGNYVTRKNVDEMHVKYRKAKGLFNSEPRFKFF
jgi:predicted metallopeptidase